MVLFKTSRLQLKKVVAESKHATNGVPRDIMPGALVLIQVIAEGRTSVSKVEYTMRYLRTTPDANDDTLRIWGKKWTHIIECVDVRRLRAPFDLRRYRKSKRNYGQAVQRFAYLDPLDVESIKLAGVLDAI